MEATHKLDPALLEPDYPLQAALGFRMTGWQDGWSEFEMPLAAVHKNRYGIPHGGLYATLLDTVMGFAGSYTGSRQDKRLAMTLSLTTNYLAQPVGRILVAEGRKVGGGRKTFFADGTVKDETGVLIATGVGTFRVRGQ